MNAGFWLLSFLLPLALFLAPIASAVEQPALSASSTGTGVLVNGTEATVVAGKPVIAVPVAAVSASGGGVQAVPVASASTTVVNPASDKAIEVNGKELMVKPPEAGGSGGGQAPVAGPTLAGGKVQSIEVSIAEARPAIAVPLETAQSTQSGGESKVVLEKIPPATAGGAVQAVPEIRITSASVAATTSLSVVVKENKMFVQSPQATETGAAKPVNIMPAAAQNAAVAQTGISSASITGMTLSIEGEGAVYKIEAAKAVKILWLIPATMPVTTTISAVDATLVSEDKPWWSFITTQ